MRRLLLAILLCSAVLANAGCLLPIYSGDPAVRTKELIFTSEDMRPTPAVVVAGVNESRSVSISSLSSPSSAPPDSIASLPAVGRRSIATDSGCTNCPRACPVSNASVQITVRASCGPLMLKTWLGIMRIAFKENRREAPLDVKGPSRTESAA